MLKSELTIRQSKERCRKPTAWFVAGSRADQWLDEISHWNVAHHQLQLIVLPKSKSNLEPIGVLVFNTDNDFSRIATSPRCTPYGQIGINLFLPVDAEMTPIINESESKEIFHSEKWFVWHPGSGLIAIAKDDCLRVSELLEVGPESFADWNLAESGSFFNERLRSIQSVAPASFDSVMEEGRDGIGERSDEIEWSRPRQPNGRGGEQGGRSVGGAGSGLAGSISNAMMAGLAKASALTGKLVPENSTPGKWVNNLQQWANQRMQTWSEELFKKRNKELFKLMEMLKNNPDQGLKFALPMSGNDDHRGLALPSSKLTRRNVDFNMGSLGGGGAADFWDVPPEIRMQLTAHYRELAEREIRLGRHRRAAYIYAELLGDIRAAAKALENGRHWRDAATIYQKQLNQVHEAARCLKEGGLWTEAIDIYMRLAEHEKAGDLYLEINLREEATTCFDLAVAVRRAKSDFVDAARIEERKLQNIELALATLNEGSQSNQAVPCIRETLRIHAEHGQHAQAEQCIHGCRDQKRSTDKKGLVQLLVSTAKKYPDRQVKRTAADTTRWIVSDAVANDLVGTGFQNSALLTAIGNLTPEDRLLGRDCRRFGSTRKQTIIQPLRLEDKRAQKIELVSSFSIKSNSHFQKAVGFPDSLLAIDVFSDELLLSRRSWSHSNPLKRIVRLVKSGSLEPSHLIVKPQDNGKFIAVRLIGCNLVPAVTDFPATQDFHKLSVGNAPHVGDETLAVEPNGSSGWGSVRWVNDTLVLDVVNSSGQIILSRVLCDSADMGSLQVPVPIFASGTDFYIAVDNRVFVVGKKNQETLEFDQQVIDITGTVRGARTRVAVVLQRGVEVFWDTISDATRVCREFENPKALFTRTGHLIVATTGKCHVFATRQNQISFVGEISIETPVSLLRADESNRFAILDQNGEVNVYEIPTNLRGG